MEAKDGSRLVKTMGGLLSLVLGAEALGPENKRSDYGFCL